MRPCRATLRSVVRLLSRVPLHPLLIAAYAVLFVYAANIGEVVPADLLWPLTIALLAAGAVLAICGLAYRNLRRGALLGSAIVVSFAFFGHVSSLLDRDVISEPVQLSLWVAFVVIVRSLPKSPRLLLRYVHLH